MSDKMHWTAEQTASPQAADHRWAVVYDPTPGGRLNADGSKTYSLRFPALILYEGLSEPENVAREIAEKLNKTEQSEIDAGDGATDINWRFDLQNCPNDVPILLKYNDGSFRFVEGADNDTEWSRWFPRPTDEPEISGVSKPVAYAVVN